MKPLHNRQTAVFKFRIFSERKRRPTDLLFRALANINHDRFKLKLSHLFESDTHAAIDISITPQRPKLVERIGRPKTRKRAQMSAQAPDAQFWIKVTASNERRHRFDLIYSIQYGDHIDLNDLETLTRLSDNVIVNLFARIPDTIIEKPGRS